jgi:hypothetical protein
MAGHPKLSERLVADPRALLPLNLWTGLAVADAILWSRRLAGAMTIPLPAPLALGSSLVVAAAAIAALVWWRETDRNWLPRAAWWPELVTLAVTLLWGLAVGAGTSAFTVGGLIATWGMLIIAVGLVHGWFPEQGGCELASDVGTPDQTMNLSDSQPSTLNPQPPSHWQKRVIVDGGEMIEGEASVEFQPGQKEALLHLSFCPPLTVAPEVHGEDALGGDIEIRTEAVHTFGARLSIRRSAGLDSAESRQISYVAVQPDVDDAAA